MKGDKLMQNQEPLIASHKIFFEYFKHITTLNTGAILLMIAFIERAFEDPEAKILAVLAFGFFVISLICSVLTMYRFAHLIWYEEEMKYPKDNKLRRAARAVILFMGKYGFVFGMVLLALFGIINIIISSPSGYYKR